MLKLIIGVFLVLHALVHLLYFGHSQRLFELKANLAWPDGSWAFSRLLGDKTTRSLASICCALAAIAFIGGALGLFIGQGWWRPVIICADAFSALSFVLFWNGQLQALPENGAIGLLIDVGLLVMLLSLQLPF